MTDETTPNAIELATELTIAWLSNPNTRAAAEDVPAFLKSMHVAVGELASPASPPSEDAEPALPEHVLAVTARKSLASKDRIISMIDGKPYKTLRRHLSTHGLTPDDYRRRYDLKPDYPMVAPTYSEHRRAMAHNIGLGARGRAARGAATPAAEAPTPASQKAEPKAKRAPRKRAPTRGDASAA